MEEDQQNPDQRSNKVPEDQQQARPLIPPMFRSVFMTSWLHNDTKDTRKIQELNKLLFKRHKTDVFTLKTVLKNDTCTDRRKLPLLFCSLSNVTSYLFKTKTKPKVESRKRWRVRGDTTCSLTSVSSICQQQHR